MSDTWPIVPHLPLATLPRVLHRKLVYIAGPYRSGNGLSVLENVRAAERAAVALARLGIHYICPHLNTAFMSGDGDHIGVATSQFFLDLDLNILARCDAVLLIGDWTKSAGSIGEAVKAIQLGIPVWQLDEEV